MLILTRLPGERILIGNDIIVEVVRLDRDSVRLGIHAPRDMEVDREEVRKRKEGKSDEKVSLD